MGLGQQRPGNLGLGLNQQQQGGGGLGLNAASGLKRGGIEQAGIGLNLGQKVGTGLSLGGSGLGTGELPLYYHSLCIYIRNSTDNYWIEWWSWNSPRTAGVFVFRIGRYIGIIVTVYH